MAITKNSGRQDLLVARVEINYDDLTSGTIEEAIDVPAGAIYQGGYVNVLTAWDSGTSDVLDVGDGDDDDLYTGSQIDLTAVACTALDAPTDADIDMKKYTEHDTIDVTWTGVGSAPTAGKLELVYHYIREDRAVETQT